MKMKSLAMVAISGLIAAFSLAYVAPALADDTSNPSMQAPANTSQGTDTQNSNGSSPTDNSTNNGTDNNAAGADQGSPDTATGDDDY